MEGTLEVFDDLAEVTSERLFPSDVNSAIGDVTDVLTLLEEDRIAFDSIENVREKGTFIINMQHFSTQTTVVVYQGAVYFL